MRNLLLVVGVLWIGLHAQLGTANLHVPDSLRISDDQPVPLAGHLSAWLAPDDSDPLQILSGALDGQFAPYRFSADTQRVTLSTAIAADMPMWLLGDTVRLQQVLTNLLDNASKFTQRGEVMLRIEPGRRTPQRIELRCSVRDTGPGIAPALQARLFQSFAQADASTTRKFGGTGLGLAICKRLVALMEGTIEIDSTVGIGSTFRFRVWLTLATAPAAHEHRLEAR